MLCRDIIVLKLPPVVLHVPRAHSMTQLEVCNLRDMRTSSYLSRIDQHLSTNVPQQLYELVRQTLLLKSHKLVPQLLLRWSVNSFGDVGHLMVMPCCL